MPDPKLKAAAEEIKVVLKRHDIGAAVVLGSTTHTEFMLEISPSWSCAWMEGNVLRLRSKLKDYPTKAAQKKHLEDTVGLLMGFITASRTNINNLEMVIDHLRHSFELYHWDRRDD